MYSKKIIGKCNLLNSTICQELFNMGIIWKFQMTHCLIKNMYANKLFEIGIIHYFLYVIFFWELGSVASNIPSQEGWEGALAKYTADAWTSTRQILESYYHYFLINTSLPKKSTLFYILLLVTYTNPRSALLLERTSGVTMGLTAWSPLANPTIS